MPPITTNFAAWQTSATTRPLKVGPGPIPDPAEDEVVIKTAYAAVNSCDWNMQANPYWEMPYPFIWGLDVAGTIVQLGTGVTRFKIGQRVIGCCTGLLTHNPTHSAFQHYSTLPSLLVSPIPATLPLSHSAVLPLSICTAAAALFIDHGLPLPSLSPVHLNRNILIWGGSSSCGSSAIQLALASGCTVLTTTSAANFEYVRNLGAEVVFNHKNADVVEDILKILQPGDLVLDCIATNETQSACGEILHRIGGGKLPCLNPPSIDFQEHVVANFVKALDIHHPYSHIGHAIWSAYIPSALAAGKFKIAPEPMIVRGGLGSVQEGIDILRKGVSARKVVVEICGEES